MSDKPSYETLEKRIRELERQAASAQRRDDACMRKASPEWRESEVRVGSGERMLAVVPDMISIHDPDMNILYSNWQGFGAVPEEKRAFNTKCYRTYRGFDDICPDCQAIKVLETRRPLKKEVRLPDGKWIDLRVIPILDDQGRLEMFMEWVRDITERKESEIALKSQKQLLEGVLDSIKDVIGVQLPDHTMLQYNRAGYELLGITEDEVRGSKCYELLGRDKPCEVCATSRAYVSRTMETVEAYIKELDRYFVCSSNPVLDEDGRIKLIIEQLVDVTEKKQADEKLYQAQKMESIGSLAGGIAHDFNNILFPIIGLSEMLLDDLPQGSPEHQSAEEILKAGRRGSELVKQILSFSRQSERRLIPIQIQRVLKEVLKLCRSIIPADIELVQDIGKDCPMVLADATQIHQIAMNLITNAYHAVEHTGGAISVRLRERPWDQREETGLQLEPGRYVVLSVSDTGMGIEPGIINKIFDPYFTTKEKGKGTGLGLATVYGIIKEHGGDIKVVSEMGKGSSFMVYLPVSDQSGKTEENEPSVPLPVGTESILLVDDEAPVVNLEKLLLQRLGYRVICFTRSSDALSVFRSDPSRFDLVVTDMNMPGMTGSQLAAELLAVRPDIPIVICTGFSERIDREKAYAAGIRGFLMKPVVRFEMAVMLREILDQKKGFSPG